MILTSFARNDINQSTSKISEKLLHKQNKKFAITHCKNGLQIDVYSHLLFGQPDLIRKSNFLIEVAKHKCSSHYQPGIFPERLLVQLWNNKSGI